MSVGSKSLQHDLRVGVIGLPGQWSSESLADEVAERTGYRLLVDLSRVSVDLASRSAIYEGTDLCQLDGLIVKKVDKEYSPSMLDRIELLRFIEACGVRVFSRPESIIRLVDRLACTVTLAGAGIPMPRTLITEDVDDAAAAIRDFGGAVLKPLYSTKARGMVILPANYEGDLAQRVQRFKDEGNPVVYVQQRLDMPDRDYGVVFLGGEYLTTYARVRAKGSWNTTTQDGGHYEAHSPPQSTIELAQRAQGLFDLTFTAVDIVDTAQGPLVFEVSAFGGFRGLLDACGINAAAAYAEHVLARLGK